MRKLVGGYVHRRKLTFLNWIDPSAEVAGTYGVRGVPMTFFINPVGEVIAVARGYMKWDSRNGRKMFDAILAGRS